MSRTINKTEHSEWFTASKQLYAISPATNAGWRWLPTGQRIRLPLSPTQLRLGSISFKGSVTIGPGAKIGHNVIVGHNTKIGPRVSIGDGCTIHNDVTLKDAVTIDPDCVIYSNCTIGPAAEIGNNMCIGSDVVIGAGVKLLPHQTIHQNEQIPTTPLQIQGSRDVVRLGADLIYIGCSGYTREGWTQWYNNPFNRDDLGYTPQQIDEYRRHLDYVAQYTTPTHPEPQDPESECT